MNVTTNGAPAVPGCTCLNRYDLCPSCRSTPEPLPPPPPSPPRKPREARPAKATPAAPEAELLTVVEVGRMVSMGTRTVYRMVEQGKFPPPLKWSRKLVRWRRADVLRWIDGLAG